MLGLDARQQRQRVRKQGENGLQRGDRSARASRQVQYQGAAAAPANRPAERGKRRFLPAHDPHLLGHAIEQAVANRPRRLRRHITRADSRASGRHHERKLVGVADQGSLDHSPLVGNYLRRSHMKAALFELPHHRRTRQVDTFSVETRIAYRNHRCRNHPYRLYEQVGVIPLRGTVSPPPLTLFDVPYIM